MDTKVLEWALEDGTLCVDEGRNLAAIRNLRVFFKTARFSLKHLKKIGGNEDDRKYILSLIDKAKDQTRKLAKTRHRLC